MYQISVNPSVVARIFGITALLLTLASVGGQFSKFLLGHDNLKGLVPLFDVSREQNIPTYFSILLMLLATFQLAVITIINKSKNTIFVWRWAILSCGFLYMAFDEAFQVHERLTYPIRTLIGSSNLGIFYYTWVIPGIAIVLVLAMFFLKFLFHLTAPTRLRFMTAATIYLGGAIGVELIGGRYAEAYGRSNLTYNMIATVEESLEMAGLILFIWALLKYFAETYGEVRFQFGAQQDTA